MAKTLYVTSTQNFSGKSALCIGLLRHLQARGLKTGYMKPFSATAKVVDGYLVDEDTVFLRNTFEIQDPLNMMSPVIFSPQLLEDALKRRENPQPAVLRTFDALCKDKDVMVVEGGANLREGWIFNLSPCQVAPLFDSTVLIVTPFDSELQCVDDLITARVRFGDRLLGAVINRVPRHRLSWVNDLVRPFFEQEGLPVLAVLPKEKTLLSISVRDLVNGLAGEVLCARDRQDELVENLLVGAMSVDNALKYFRRKPNKAIITGGDRPDIQLAALETSTKCIILTGNIRPNPLILGKAEDAGVPLILTQHDTMTAVEIIEGFFGKTRFHQTQKIQRFEALMQEHMDFDRLNALMEI